MLERPATFGGWGFTGVPAGAHLLHLTHRVRVPAAAGNVVIDGTAPLGGTDYVVSRAALENGAPMRVRLVALGFGLWDFQRLYTGSFDVPSMGSHPINTLLTLTGATDEPLEELHLEGVTAGLTLRPSAVGTDFALIPTTGIKLRRVAVSRDLAVGNPTGGNIIVRGYGTRLECGKAEQITIHVRRAALTPGGAIAGTSVTLGGGRGWPVHPQPLPYGQEPATIPVAPDASWCDLGAGEAFSVIVANDALGDVPESATVCVRLVLAVWPEGPQS